MPDNQLPQGAAQDIDSQETREWMEIGRAHV